MKNTNKKLSTTIQTSPTQVIHAESKEFTTEYHEVKPKNPNLIHLFSIGHHNFWFNKNNEEVWISLYDPQIRKQEEWQKLMPHDIKDLFLLGLLSEKNFKNPFPRRVYLRKAWKRKMRHFLDKIEG